MSAASCLQQKTKVVANKLQQFSWVVKRKLQNLGGFSWPSVGVPLARGVEGLGRLWEGGLFLWVLAGVLSSLFPPSTQLKEACPEPHFSLELQRSLKPILSPFCDPWGLLCSVQLRGAPVRVLSAPPPMRHSPHSPCETERARAGPWCWVLTLRPTHSVPYPPSSPHVLHSLFPIPVPHSPGLRRGGGRGLQFLGVSFCSFPAAVAGGKPGTGTVGEVAPQEGSGRALRSCHRAPLTAIEALCSALDGVLASKAGDTVRAEEGPGTLVPVILSSPPLPPKALWPCMLLGSTWRLHSL